MKITNKNKTLMFDDEHEDCLVFRSKLEDIEYVFVIVLELQNGVYKGNTRRYFGVSEDEKLEDAIENAICYGGVWPHV